MVCCDDCLSATQNANFLNRPKKKSNVRDASLIIRPNPELPDSRWFVQDLIPQDYYHATRKEGMTGRGRRRERKNRTRDEEVGQGLSLRGTGWQLPWQKGWHGEQAPGSRPCRSHRLRHPDVFPWKGNQRVRAFLLLLLWAHTSIKRDSIKSVNMQQMDLSTLSYSHV
jgi:hypothetical protein